MVCIYCSGVTGVVNSRAQKRTNTIWRRRLCNDCKSVFTSLEGADLRGSIVFKVGAGIQPFSRDKLFISVYDSLRHRKTAVADAEGLTTTIIGRLYPLIQNAALTRNDLINTAIGVLQRFDKAASTYYKAFHPLNPKIKAGSWKIGE